MSLFGTSDSADFSNKFDRNPFLSTVSLSGGPRFSLGGLVRIFSLKAHPIFQTAWQDLDEELLNPIERNFSIREANRLSDSEPDANRLSALAGWSAGGYRLTTQHRIDSSESLTASYVRSSGLLPHESLFCEPDRHTADLGANCPLFWILAAGPHSNSVDATRQISSGCA